MINTVYPARFTIRKMTLKLTCPFKPVLVLYTNYVKKGLILLDYDVSQFSLPTKRKKITVLKSPHVNKRFKEHFCSFRYKSALCFEYNRKMKPFLKYIFINKPKSISLKLIF